jgi:hypothetical protein
MGELTMSFNNWLQNVGSALAPSRAERRRGPRGSHRAATNRLHVEALEDRLTPSFTWAGDFPGGIWGTGPETVPADFTSDGIPDQLGLDGWGLFVLPGRGDGTFGAPIRTDGTRFAGWVTVTDFNGDGQPDVFLAYQGYDFGGYGNVWLGAGDGTFVAHQASIGGESDSFAYTIGDFNGDGRPDVAWNQVDFNLYEWVGTEYLNAGDWGLSGPYLSLSNARVTEGNSGTVNADFILSIAHASNVDLTFNYNTSDGTATAGSDYQAASGTLTIPGGQTAGTIRVQVNGDSLPEPDESFSVYLSREHWSDVTIGYGTGTIVDDEPHISISDVNVMEGNTGTRAASFAVTLSPASTGPVTVAYATGDSSAFAGNDYQAISGMLTFAPGETSRTIGVPVNGDRVPEPNEAFVVNLSGATNATIADNQGVGTIMDDEPRISISDVTKYEGKNHKTTLFTFTVTLSAAYDQAVTMSFGTVNGTATMGDSDYVTKSGTLTFAPGETTKTITIEVKGDSKREANETFYIDLFGNSGNSLFTKNRGLGTILNDD